MKDTVSESFKVPVTISDSFECFDLVVAAFDIGLMMTSLKAEYRYAYQILAENGDRRRDRVGDCTELFLYPLDRGYFQFKVKCVSGHLGVPH